MKPRTLINEWSTTKNFWLLHPELKADALIESHFKRDRSAGHNKSSKLMWFVAFCYDSESAFWGMPEKGPKGSLVSLSKANWVKSKATDPDDFYSKNQIAIAELKAKWIELSYNPGDLMLLDWREKMEQRGKVIQDTEYRFDSYNEEGKVLKGNVKEFDEMISRTPKMFEQLMAIEKARSQENKEGKSFGNAKDSLSDSGEI
jgi:adenine-specific DNA methylase